VDYFIYLSERAKDIKQNTVLSQLSFLNILPAAKVESIYDYLIQICGYKGTIIF
jgi:hypothetical protein